jgi:hypothetical protein
MSPRAVSAALAATVTTAAAALPTFTAPAIAAIAAGTVRTAGARMVASPIASLTFVTAWRIMGRQGGVRRLLHGRGSAGRLSAENLFEARPEAARRRCGCG